MFVLPSEIHFCSMPGWMNHVVLSGSTSWASVVAFPVPMCCLPQPPNTNNPVGLCMIVVAAPPHSHRKRGSDVDVVLEDMQGVPLTTNVPVGTAESRVPGSVLSP